jgi:hypothetical protein
MSAAIGCPKVGDFPRGTDTADRSAPPRSRGRPHPVASELGLGQMKAIFSMAAKSAVPKTKG